MCTDTSRYKTVWMVCACLSLGACAIQPHAEAAKSEQLQKQYQHAIEEAAVRHADWNIPLWSFGDASAALVSTFTDDPALDTVTQYNWVAPTAQVRSLCHGKSNSVLFLEELRTPASVGTCIHSKFRRISSFVLARVGWIARSRTIHDVLAGPHWIPILLRRRRVFFCSSFGIPIAQPSPAVEL